MTTDARTEAEKRYDALKDGSAYVKPAYDAAEYDRLIGILEKVEQHTAPPSERPLGTIAGCVVTGTYNDQEPYELYYGSMTWNGMEISTDGENWASVPTGEMLTGEHLLGGCGDMYLREWQAIKALAHTDIMEQLIALVRVKRGLATLPAVPANEVYVERLYHEGDDDGDLIDEPRGPLAYVDYCAGESPFKAAISFNVDGQEHEPMVFMLGLGEINLDQLLGTLPNLIAVLNDPRVQTAIEERKAKQAA